MFRGANAAFLALSQADFFLAQSVFVVLLTCSPIYANYYLFLCLFKMTSRGRRSLWALGLIAFFMQLSAGNKAFAQLDSQYRNQQNAAEQQRQSAERLCRQITDNAQYRGTEGVFDLEDRSYWLVDSANKIFTVSGKLNGVYFGGKKCGYVSDVGAEVWKNPMTGSACDPNRKMNITEGGVTGIAQAAYQICQLTKYVVEGDALVVYTQMSRDQGGDGQVNRSVVATR